MRRTLLGVYVVGSISSLTHQLITFLYRAWRSLISSAEHAWRCAHTRALAWDGSVMAGSKWPKSDRGITRWLDDQLAHLDPNCGMLEAIHVSDPNDRELPKHNKRIRASDCHRAVRARALPFLDFTLAHSRSIGPSVSLPKTHILVHNGRSHPPSSLLHGQPAARSPGQQRRSPVEKVRLEGQRCHSRRRKAHGHVSLRFSQVNVQDG